MTQASPQPNPDSPLQRFFQGLPRQGLPSRIRKMSKRRQKTATVRWLGKRIEDGLLEWLRRTPKIPANADGIKQVKAELNRQFGLLAPLNYEVTCVSVDEIRRHAHFEYRIKPTFLVEKE